MRRFVSVACGLPGLIILWLLASTAGLVLMVRYGSSPSPAGIVQMQWPADSLLPRIPNADNLVVFIHPACPCTKATLLHLEEVVARHSIPLLIVKMTPTKESSAFKQDASQHRNLLERLTAYPSVRIIADVDARESQRFGATASGTCFLYSSTGQLMFSGGVTSSRGHQGDNSGLASLIEQIKSPTVPAQYPVFGCSLQL